MGEVFGIDDEQELEAIHALPGSSENDAKENPIQTALDAIQAAESAKNNKGNIHLHDLFSRVEPTQLANRITNAPASSDKLREVSRSVLGEAPVEDSNLTQALLEAVTSVDTSHHNRIEKLIAEADRKQEICDLLLEARRHLNQAKEGELEMTQELYDKLLALDNEECAIMDERIKEEFLQALEKEKTYILSAETLAEMKSLAVSHSERVKSAINRDFTTKLQPAFSDMQSILEAMKKMLEMKQREHDVYVRNQIPR